MRTATNMILSAIAISDTMTGLVTMPTYIMVYYNTQNPLQYEDYFHINSTNITQYYDNPVTQSHVDGYVLSKDLCRGFMLSKYLLSKMFHTVSIFLTLFLAVQRYTSVAFPYKSQRIYTVRNTVIVCLIIFFVSPLLHLYHVTTDKAVDGICQWELGEDGCGGDCIYLWLLFIVRHFIPCVSLTISTVIFIKHLRGGARNFGNMDGNSLQNLNWIEENRSISTIVIVIVVVFLIPEIPYGVFLFYHAIDKATTNGENSNLEVNRGIHMGYELLLVLSFNANFYIYTF
jgi:TRAP-type mannitol/chloroaromatic compound transport system permease small subunit